MLVVLTLLWTTLRETREIEKPLHKVYLSNRDQGKPAHWKHAHMHILAEAGVNEVLVEDFT